MRSGYDTSWQLPFKIIGRNGVDLNDKWKPYPRTYLSMAVDGFPNMFMSLGPNSVIGAGTLLPIMEYAVMYAVQATAKIQRERLKSIEVKSKAVNDFDKYIQVRRTLYLMRMMWIQILGQSYFPKVSKLCISP